MSFWLIERVRWRGQGYEAQMREPGFLIRASRLEGENRWTIDALAGPDYRGLPSVLHFDNGFGHRHTNRQVTIPDPELATALDQLAGMVPPDSTIAYGLLEGPFPDERSASLGNETVPIREAYPADLLQGPEAPRGAGAPTSPTPKLRVVDARPHEPTEPWRIERGAGSEWCSDRHLEAASAAPEAHL